MVLGMDIEEWENASERNIPHLLRSDEWKKYYFSQESGKDDE